jgi:hypothetical protein
MQFLLLIIALANQPAYVRGANTSHVHTIHTGGICPGATHFYSGKVKPYWTKTLEFKCKIGDHYFYGKKQHERNHK